MTGSEVTTNNQNLDEGAELKGRHDRAEQAARRNQNARGELQQFDPTCGPEPSTRENRPPAREKERQQRETMLTGATKTSSGKRHKVAHLAIEHTGG